MSQRPQTLTPRAAADSFNALYLLLATIRVLPTIASTSARHAIETSRAKQLMAGGGLKGDGGGFGGGGGTAGGAGGDGGEPGACGRLSQVVGAVEVQVTSLHVAGHALWT